MLDFSLFASFAVLWKVGELAAEKIRSRKEPTFSGATGDGSILKIRFLTSSAVLLFGAKAEAETYDASLEFPVYVDAYTH